MTILQAILLGLVQGLTEFLPVSSSAHLVIIQHFFQVTGSTALVFDIAVHLGTLTAILFFFRKDFFPVPKIGVRMMGLIVLATVPTGIIGILLHDKAEFWFSSVRAAGAGLLITSGILWSTRYLKNRESGTVHWFDALLIGIVQGIAVIPGISRSGSTISAGLWRKMKPEEAAKFSFYLAIPAILGAAVLEGKKTLTLVQGGMCPVLVTGFVAAFISGYFAITVLLKIISRGRFHYFAFYTLLLSFLAFLLA